MSIRAQTKPRKILSHGPALWALFVILLVCCASWHTLLADDSRAQAPLPLLKVRINDVSLTMEVASTAQQRFMGLSFRESMPENAGMLFVYQAERPLSFTMRNTLIPLSIAFLSKDLVINEIHDMDVGPGQIFDSQQQAQFALEVNQGWFSKNGIKPGDKLVRE